MLEFVVACRTKTRRLVGLAVGRRMARLAGCLILAACLWCLPANAYAQQRNLGWAVDGGWEILAAPSLPTAPANKSAMPLRLRYGWRLGAEATYKLQHDKWRVYGRFNVHFLKFSQGAPMGTFDNLANHNIGTVLAWEPEVGVRYTIWTDKVRPFVQAGVSYVSLHQFGGGDAPCPGGKYCAVSGIGSASDLFLPHTNIMSLHVQPGLEVSLRRDVALHVGVDIQRWLLWNASDSTMFTLAAGVTFYS